jgi:hypothetical protein
MGIHDHVVQLRAFAFVRVAVNIQTVEFIDKNLSKNPEVVCTIVNLDGVVQVEVDDGTEEF